MQGNQLILTGIIGLVIIAAFSSLIYVLGEEMKVEKELLKFSASSIAQVIALLYLIIIIFKKSLIRKLLNRKNLLINTFLLSTVSLSFTLTIEYLLRKCSGVEFNTLKKIDMIYAIPVLLFIVPIVEEVIFRGLILMGLRKHVGDKAAVFISSIFFTIAHAQALPPIMLPIVFVEGIMLSYPVITWNSLTPSIITHSLINLQAIILSKVKLIL